MSRKSVPTHFFDQQCFVHPSTSDALSFPVSRWPCSQLPSLPTHMATADLYFVHGDLRQAPRSRVVGPARPSSSKP